VASFENQFGISAMSEFSIFHGGLDIADPQSRAAYLDQACAGDAALRQRVEDLLQAHLLTAPFMSRPAAEALGGAESNGLQPRTVIAGRYTLVESVGQGGMGQVWVAEQTDPVKRRVAVKRIKAGMDSHAVVGEARRWFDKALQWMEKNRADSPEFGRFRAEAESLLGMKKK